MASNVRQKTEHWRPIVACGGSQRLASRRKAKSQVTSVSLPPIGKYVIFNELVKFQG